MQVLRLLHESKTSHVRVAVEPPPATGVLVIVPTTRGAINGPGQASVAVGGSKFHALPHSTVLGAAQVRTGGVVSTMVTTWVQVLRLPQVSNASQIRFAMAPHTPVALVTVPKTFAVVVALQVS